MRLEVPFYKQTTKLNCGPVALRMVLAYFGQEVSLDVLEQRTGIKEGKGVSTIQLATVASSLGYKTDFFSKHIYFNEDNLKLEFYQRYSDAIQQSKQIVEDAKTAGVMVEKKVMSLEELLQKISEDSIAIILLDWNIVKGTREKGYQGHFVPIVGYDDENMYVHNHGLDDPRLFLPIKREIFEEARKAQGTDEDIIIIHRET
ncbi:MAG: peptidase C39 family protein [Nanoarchaeota archaeon]